MEDMKNYGGIYFHNNGTSHCEAAEAAAAAVTATI